MSCTPSLPMSPRAEVVPPAPNAGQHVGLIGHHRRGTDPQVVVERLGRLGGLGMADRFALLTVPGFRDQHLANDSALQSLHGLAHVRGAAALRADLHHALVAAGGLDHQPAFADVVAARLFDVDVLAGVAGQNRGGGVPMVGRGNPHGVDTLVVEHATQVLDRLGRRAAELLSRGGGCSQASFIDVAHVRDLHLLVFGQQVDVMTSHASGSDHADDESLIGIARLRCARVCQCGGRRGRLRGLLEKLPAICGRHVSDP